MTDSLVELAFCADKNVEKGLHVAALSAVNRVQGSVRVHVLTDVHSPVDPSMLQSTLGPSVEIVVHVINSDKFQSFSPLLDNTFVYAKLLLAEVIEEPRVIYIDCDVVVLCDLKPLWRYDLAESIIGAVKENSVRKSLEADLLMSKGMAPTDPYFNAGVMLMNLNKWREGGISEEAFSFIQAHDGHLPTGDQTVLNSVLRGRISLLDARFNFHWPAHRNEVELRSKDFIAHFVGGLKPWSFGGRFFHSGFSEWEQVFRETALAQSMRSTDTFEPRRFFRRLPYYIRVLRKRIMMFASQWKNRSEGV